MTKSSSGFVPRSVEPLRELWEELAEVEPEPLLRTGRCLAYGEGDELIREDATRSKKGLFERRRAAFG